MPQSSLTTWLNKPQTVKQSPMGPENVSPQTPQAEQLPTPPSSRENTKITEVAEDFGNTLKSLPVNIELRACTRDDISSLKRLTSLLLPIAYPDKFYKEIVEDPLTNNITLLAVWHDDPAMVGKQKGRLVGAIRCRLLAHPQGEPSTRNHDKPMLYLSTLAVLSPYRTHGIACHMLQTLTKRAVETYGISHVGAHVWEANAEGLNWYRKRGFREVGRESNYYRRLDPQGAVVVQRDIGVMDMLPK
ncbi:N-alpha-acetyltransferase 50 [Pseudocercospora fuligena]|uniref:N-alpha-acetyltransferase 50 n=1 Tax=Pseudocercospora fuligena TaxID=685502 RepID=A0A8H6RUN3_9PEZI|nr:N-alpha-acetyltransferase 50 [Pseudocercospora fuligena]